MYKSMSISRKTITAKSIITLLAIASAVALPQLFHAVGTISGTGAQLGSALLPMHIPVLLAGFLGGPIVGVLAGIISPVISFGISGMPTAALVPFMIVELGTYGLVSGLLSKARVHSFVKLILAQLAGRAARAGAILAAIYLLGSRQFTLASIGAFVTAGLFGILLQWALIPLLTQHMERLRKLYE